MGDVWQPKLVALWIMYHDSLAIWSIFISDSARSQNVLSGLVGLCAVDQDNLSGLVRISTNEELS